MIFMSDAWRSFNAAIECTPWKRNVAAMFLGLIMFTAYQEVRQTLGVDTTPPITVHSVWIDGRPKPGQMFAMVVDRTKHRQCQSKWRVVLTNERGDAYTVSYQPGSTFAKERRGTFRYWYRVPLHIPPGHYTLISTGFYTCADGGQHIIEQPEAPVEIVQ